jgi:aminoglycoside phosphotransferase family enzyme
MKRLPAEGMLENMIRKGEATTEDIEKVAAVIAEFHKNAAVTPKLPHMESRRRYC